MDVRAEGEGLNAPLERAHFLGSSDMAAVLGLSPWKTALDVYLEKRGEVPPADVDPEKAKLFRRGKRLEPVIVNMLEEERGLQIVARNERYRDAEHPFLACEVDAEALVEGERVNVECKTAHHFTAWKYGEEGTDEVPVEYACQAMYALMVTGRSRCIFGVLFGADNLVVYDLTRDEDTVKAMRAQAVRFWHDHVLAGVPPEPRTFEDVCKLFRKAPASEVEASPEVQALCIELQRVKDAARVADERQVEIKYEIGKFMLGESGIMLGTKGRLLPGPNAKLGHHLLTHNGITLLDVNLQEQSRLDTDRVRKDYPEVAAECSKSISFYRFDRPRKKRGA